MIFTILPTFLGKSCYAHMLHASGATDGAYYSYMTYFILNSGRSYTTFGVPRYLFLELIQGAFWAQNRKNDGFTKMSVEW